ncbi:MAG: hypothetical protein JSV47_03265 [Deltaproteobacteria bacterium]|nr:MAG: hypothetical protein JSV47_03265 [Deltaproteobacteria bacterium]
MKGWTKMQKMLLTIAGLVVILSTNPSLTYSKKTAQRLETNSAAVILLSLQLGEKAMQLFDIKDDLIRKVQQEVNNITQQERFMLDVISELKYVATVAYFEGNLLGAVLAIKEDFKLDFVSNRILEFEQSIASTKSSMMPIQVAYSGIQDTAVREKIAKAREIILSLEQLYRKSIETLQKMKQESTKSDSPVLQP